MRGAAGLLPGRRAVFGGVVRPATRNGRPAAVLMSLEDLEGLVETLEVLSTPGEVAAVREGEAAASAGDVFTLDQVRADLAARPAADGG